MADETTDVRNHSQMVVVIRWVRDDLEVFEDFLGLQQMERIDAASIVAALKDTLMRMNLAFSKMRGQCYDGCSTMTGAKKGVSKKIQEEQPKAIFTHCYGHALNLAACDAVKANKLLRDALDTTYEITKLVKLSPKRDSIFQRIKSELAIDQSGLRVLCPTRWTVRADALNSVLANYEALQELWEVAAAVATDSETKARLNGVASQMRSFDFFFGCTLGEVMLRHTDNLSKSLQTDNISAADGQKNAQRTTAALQSLRCDEEFDAFWKLVLDKASKSDVNDPALPRKRKRPARFNEGTAPAEFSLSVEDHYRKVFFEVVDHLIGAITDRFDQPGYKIYSSLEQLLLKGVGGKPIEEELTGVCGFYD